VDAGVCVRPVAQGADSELLLRDMPVALPFYTDALGLRLPYSDPDFEPSKEVITEGVVGCRFRDANPPCIVGSAISLA